MKKGTLQKMILASLIAVTTAMGGLIRIPVGETAVTMQFFFTALAGLLLGWKWGAISQIIYVALGLMGFPVFAAGGGLGYFLQPSFGFVLGLIPAAATIGILRKYGTLPACVGGLLLLYTVGISYIVFICNGLLHQNLPWSAVLFYGVLLYLPGDCIKLFIIRSTVPSIRKAIGLSCNTL